MSNKFNANSTQIQTQNLRRDAVGVGRTIALIFGGVIAFFFFLPALSFVWNHSSIVLVVGAALVYFGRNPRALHQFRTSLNSQLSQTVQWLTEPAEVPDPRLDQMRRWIDYYKSDDPHILTKVEFKALDARPTPAQMENLRKTIAQLEVDKALLNARLETYQSLFPLFVVNGNGGAGKTTANGAVEQSEATLG